MTSAEPTRIERGFMPLIVFAVSAGLVSVSLDIWQDLSGVGVGMFPFAALGPAVGAIVTWIAFRSRLAALMPPAVAPRQVVAHLVLGLVASVVLLGITLGVLALAGTATQPLVAEMVPGVPVAITLAGVALAAALQEIGIRGLAQPLLEHAGSRLLAALVVGAIWGFWVVQLFAMENSPIVVGAMFFATTTFSVLLGYLGNGSPLQRIAVTIPVHAVVATVLAVANGAQPVSSGIALALLVATVVTTAVFMAMFTVARRRRAQRATA